MGDNAYLRIGAVLGGITGLCTFVGCWWYCAATYGFLLGFGLGWLPAGIAAILAGLAVMFLWGLAVAAVLVVALIIWIDTRNAERRAEKAAHEERMASAPVVSNEAVIISGPNHLAGGPQVQDGDLMRDRNASFVRTNGRWVLQDSRPGG